MSKVSVEDETKIRAQAGHSFLKLHPVRLNSLWKDLNLQQEFRERLAEQLS